MHLKELELRGFKSFPQRTRLRFDEGITAIVGPNGCGKSNIGDAIRWVLGEQSAKALRGNRMDDVIFAGSRERDPMNFCEVSLTVTNPTGALPVDYSEVTVTRRLYRSGESEYYINKTPCRLKDIHTLFMGTGIGRDGYSSVGQGHIDDILSTRPEDRRAVFEEAAGISRYKAKKKEAENKLKRTDEDLVRVSDIISELETQLGPLERQARQAAKYRELTSELRKREIDLLVNSLKQARTRWQEGEEELKILADELAGKEQELQDARTRHDRLQAAATTLDGSLDELRERQHRLINIANRISGKIQVLSDRLGAASREQDRVTGDLESAQKEFALNRSKFDIVRQEKAELKKSLTTLRENLKDKISQRGELEQKGTTGRGLKKQLERDLLAVKNDKAAKQGRLDSAAEEERRTRERLDKTANQLSEAREALDRLLSQIAALNKGKESHKNRLGELEAELGRVKKEREDSSWQTTQCRKTVLKLINDLEGAKSRLRYLEGARERREGLFFGVKTVFAGVKQGELHGIEGIVAELIDVPKHLETAVETVLGSALQHVVTAREEDAKQAVRLLKKKQGGRATFLPLDVITEKDEVRIPNIESPGYLGCAKDLIGYAPRYVGIIQFLLGNVLVAEDLDQAASIARETGYRFRVVSLDGDIIARGGALTGGSSQNRGSLLAQAREIDEVKEQQGRLAAELSRERKHLGELEAREEELARQVLAAENELFQEKQKIKDADEELGRLSNQEAAVRDSIENLTLELKSHHTELDGLENSRSELSEQLRKLAERENELTQRIAAVDEELRSGAFEDRAAEEEITRLRIEIRGLEEKRSHQALEEERLDRECVSLEERSKRLADEIEHLSSLYAMLRSKRKLYQGRLEKLQNAAEKGEEQMAAYRCGLAEVREGLSSLRERIRRLEEEEKTTSEKQQQLALENSRWEWEFKNSLERLGDDFGLGLNEALRQASPVAEPEEVAKRIRSVKRSVKRLGEVNLGALKEYERIKERYDCLTAERADLLETRKELNKLMRRMDRVMAGRFREAFEAVRAHFKSIFTELFQGGEGELILTDPQNVLESGVEIRVSPPGKKMVPLLSLSGGEKTLTAIALLFALLRFRPSPFCVFDEIEAALDDANLGRFVRFIKRIEDIDQILIVTHRRQTMKLAARLYGITMDGSGVSRVVPLELDKQAG